MIFMLHNLEEIIMVEKWIQKTYPRVRHKIPSSIQKELNRYQDMTSIQFAVTVFVLSVFASILILVAVMTQHYYLFLGINFIFAINILTHPLQAMYLRCYTPGLMTSLFLIIPYYSLFFYHFHNTELLNLNSILGAIIVIVFFIPVFLFSHKIGQKWNF